MKLVRTHIVKLMGTLSMLIYLHFLFQTESWKRLSTPQGATSTVSLRNPVPSRKTFDGLSEVDLEEHYYRNVETPEVKCIQEVLMGYEAGGGFHLCNDSEYQPRHPCLVYSFGVNYEFSFEYYISFIYRCMVHSFDSRMRWAEGKVSQRISFNRVGLGDTDHEKREKTLTFIKAFLSHSNVDIDVLKMDLDNGLHKVLPQIMASGELRHVKQLMFKIYFPGFENKTLAVHFLSQSLKLLRELHYNGFFIFHSQKDEDNFVTSPFTGMNRTTSHKLSLVNVLSKIKGY